MNLVKSIIIKYLPMPLWEFSVTKILTKLFFYK
jgi:hypothetical protein